MMKYLKQYAFLSLGLLFFALPARAAIVSDDFESGNLSSWTVSTSSTATLYVSTSTNPCPSTPNPTHCAINYSSGSGTAYGEQQTIGTYSPYGFLRFYWSNGLINTQSTNFVSFRVGSSNKGSLQYYQSSTSTQLRFVGAQTTILSTALATSTWHYITWQYSSVLNSIRFKVNTDTVYGPWLTFLYSSAIDRVRISNDISANGYVVAFDDFRTSDSDIFVPYYLLDVPVNGTLVKDFSYWTVEYYAPFSTSTTYTLYVQYGTAPGSVSWIDQDVVPNTNALTVYNVAKSNPLSNGTYYVTFALYNQNGDLVGYSSETGFVVDNQNGNNAVTQSATLFTATTTFTNLSVTCDSKSGFFASSFCNLYQTLFIPSADNLNTYNNFKNSLANKPPWGYWSLITNAWNGVGSSTSAYYYASSNSGWGNIENYIKGMTTIFIWFFFFAALIKSLRKLQI